MCGRFITWAAWRASACTTTSRPWCSGVTPTARCTIPSSSPSPRTMASAPKPAACAARKPRAKSNGSSTMSRPACSMAAPSTRWHISRLVRNTQSGVRQRVKCHHPQDDPRERELLLRQRFQELGPIAVQFFDGLLHQQTYGKMQAQQLLALTAHYQRADVLKALERAVRFGAFSLAAVRRLLAATAKPKPLLDELAERYKD